MGANAKFIVETAGGKRGVVYVNKPKLGGKVCVYLTDEKGDENGKFLLCRPESLKNKGIDG